MAHIPDGILSLPVLVGGGVIAGGGLLLSLRSLDETTIPKTAIFSAVFFAASLIAIPVGPSSVHLLLAGLMGLVIGPLVIPAVLVGLVLQLVMFGFGGLTTLGVNTVNIAFPGMLLAAMAAPLIARANPTTGALLAGAVGGLSVLVTGGLVALSLALSSSDYVPSARILLVTYIPLMIGEAVITGVAVGFVRRVKPELMMQRLGGAQ